MVRCGFYDDRIDWLNVLQLSNSFKFSFKLIDFPFSIRDSLPSVLISVIQIHTAGENVNFILILKDSNALDDALKKRERTSMSSPSFDLLKLLSRIF